MANKYYSKISKRICNTINQLILLQDRWLCILFIIALPSNLLCQENNPISPSNLHNAEISTHLLNVKKNNGVFHPTILNHEFHLVFGLLKENEQEIWEDLTLDSLVGYIINPSYEERQYLHSISAQEPSFGGINSPVPMCSLNDTALLIPFNIDEEVILLTRWHTQQNDSIKFVNVFLPEIYLKHTSIRTMKFIGSNTIILQTEGGEQGENWLGLLVLQLEDEHNFTIIDHVITGFCNDCGDVSQLTYTINNQILEVTETRDSMVFIEDKIEPRWTNINSKKSLLKRIKLPD
ncbi:MAG: hypothetical protein P1U56_24915 [Saprospiraceae bacterium]|nr:hypothetical protein [Saprospiraceae bacterium]